MGGHDKSKYAMRNHGGGLKPFPGLVFSRRIGGNVAAHRGALGAIRFEVQVPPVSAHNRMTNRQPKPLTFYRAPGFGGEIRVEDFGPNFVKNSGARIGKGQDHVRTRGERKVGIANLDAAVLGRASDAGRAGKRLDGVVE